MKSSNNVNKIKSLKIEIVKMKTFLEFLNGKKNNKFLNKKNVN